jgi:hypothetical protein
VRYESVYSSTALCWALAAFPFLVPKHGRYDSLDGGSARRNAATYTQTQTQNKHTDHHALSGIRTHDPIVRAGKNSSCLWPRGHCDRREMKLLSSIQRTEIFCNDGTVRILPDTVVPVLNYLRIMPWRRRGSRCIALSFFTSALDGDEWLVSSPGQLYSRGNFRPVPIGYEAGGATETVCTLWGTEKSYPCRESNKVRPVDSRTTSYGLQGVRGLLRKLKILVKSIFGGNKH